MSHSIGDLILSFVSHDWAGLVLALIVATLGAACIGVAWLKSAGWLTAVGGVVIGVGALMALGSTYHLIHMARVRSQDPPPGVLVDIGGYRLHLLAEGDTHGKPTLVWMPGSHAGGFALYHLHALFRSEARSTLIDRPGSGWSDIGPFPRTSAVEAEEIVAALQKAGEKGPFVLIGHSLGGLLMANIARRHPQLIAAVVLLDATPPDAVNYAPPNPYLAQMRTDAMWSAMQRLFGIHHEISERLWGGVRDPAAKRVLDIIAQRLGPALERLRAIEDGARSSTANASIFLELDHGGLGWDTTVYDGDLEDLPVYLVAPRDLPEFKAVATAMYKDAGEAMGPQDLYTQRLLRFYTRARERYMAVSSKTERIYAPEESGHNFPYEHPGFVADVVRRVLSDASRVNP